MLVAPWPGARSPAMTDQRLATCAVTSPTEHRAKGAVGALQEVNMHAGSGGLRS